MGASGGSAREGVAAARAASTRAVVGTLAGVSPPARDRDAAAEAAALVRWARVDARGGGALAAELDTAEAASRLVSLLSRVGITEGAVHGDPGRLRWRVDVAGGGTEPPAVRLGLADGRGRPLTTPPPWLTGGSLPGAVATWRGALLARALLRPDDDPGGSGDAPALVVGCPTPGAALALAEHGLRLGVRARTRRHGPGARVEVVDAGELALLLTTVGGRATAETAGLADRAADPAGSANEARATVAASRAGAAVEEAFATLTAAGVTVPDQLAEAGRLRLAHPDLGLADLASRAVPPMSKDALAGRLRRLSTLAGRHRR